MCLSMFVVTFSLGYLPTKMAAPTKIMNIISIYGAGLLVGSALIVIIPEGMSVLYSSLTTSPTQIGLYAMNEGESSRSSLSASVGAGNDLTKENLTQYVGLSLIFGFTLMLVLDQSFLIYKEAVIKRDNSHSKDISCLDSLN